MGQKVNPIGMRVGINRTWDSRWFADRDYATKLIDDLKLRKYVHEKLKAAGVSKVIVEGADIETLRKELAEKANAEVSLNIVEIRKPEVDAQLVAEGVAQQLERRVAFRRAMKRAVQSALRMGGQGIRINVSGRLAGADIARMEWYREGRVPLHTLRADIDFGFAEALTTYGIIGCKVWIYKGDVMGHDPMARDKRLADAQGADRGGQRPENRDDRPREDRGGRGKRNNKDKE